MAQIPKSFREAFDRNRAQLEEYIYVSSSLTNQLLQNGLLNQRHVDELKV